MLSIHPLDYKPSNTSVTHDSTAARNSTLVVKPMIYGISAARLGSVWPRVIGCQLQEINSCRDRRYHSFEQKFWWPQVQRELTHFLVQWELTHFLQPGSIKQAMRL